MKKIAIIFLTLITIYVKAQDRLFTRTGIVEFYSHAPIEDIKATSKQLTLILDKKTGDVVAKVLIRSFEFKKALMQEHFNENYMESEKYPYSKLKAKIANINEVNFDKDGVYPVKLVGELTIKDKTNSVEIPGKITVKKGKVSAYSQFYVNLKDYNIKNDKPKSISNKIQVTVNADLEPYKR